jgi:hypothetical protein
MLNVDEENYKEAVDSSYKVSVTPGISKLTKKLDPKPLNLSFGMFTYCLHFGL